MSLNKEQIQDAVLLDEVYLQFRKLDYDVAFAVEMVKAWATLQKKEK